MKNFLWSTLIFIGKILNRNNLNKVLILFAVGLTSRIIVGYFYGVNVYLEYLHTVSLIYYTFMALFVVLLHELISYFEFNVIPNFILDLYPSIIKLSKSVYYNISIVNENIYRFGIIKSFNNLSYFILNIKTTIINTLSNINRDKSKYMTTGISSLSYEISPNKSIEDSPPISNINNKNGSSELIPSKDKGKGKAAPAESVLIPNKCSSSNKPSYVTEINKANTPDSINTEFGHDYRFIGRDDELLFVVDTVKEHDTFYDRPLYTPSPNKQSNYSLPLVAPNVTRPSNFSTPATMSPLFPSSIYSNDSFRESNNCLNDNTGDIRMGVPPLFNKSGVKAGIYKDISTSTTDIPIQTQEARLAAVFSKYKINFPNVQGRNLPSPAYSRHPINASYLIDEDIDTSTRQTENQLNIARFANTSANPGLTGEVWNDTTTILQDMPGLINKEIPINKPGLFGKFKIGFNISGSKFSKIESVYAKYERVGKRHIIWNLFERDRNNYESYEDFKKHWDSDTKLWNEIKKRTKTSFKSEINEIFSINRNPRELQSGINGQIEDFIKESRSQRTHNSNNKGNNQGGQRHIRRNSPLRNHRQHGSNNIKRSK